MGAWTLLTIYAVVLLLLALWTWREPTVAVAGLALVKVIDLLGQVASPWLYGHPRFTNLVVAAVALGALFMRVAYPGMGLAGGAPRLRLTVWCLWAYALTSLAWSPAQQAGLAEWLQHGPYVLLLGVIAPLLVRNAEGLHRALRALVVLGAMVTAGLLAVPQWGLRSVHAVWSPAVTIWDPLAFGQVAGYMGLCATLLAYERRPHLNAFRAAAIALAVWMTLTSGSRGQFVLLVLMASFLVGWKGAGAGWRRIGVVSGIVLVFAAVALIAFEILGNVEERWAAGKITAAWALRVDMVRAALSAWWSQPVAVVFGLGNSASFAPYIVGGYPHNVPFEILTEEGLLGAGLFLGAITYAFAIFQRARRMDLSVRERGVLWTLVALLAYSVGLSLKQGSLVGYSPVFFLFAIILEQYYRILLKTKRSMAVREGPQLPPVLALDGPRQGPSGDHSNPIVYPKAVAHQSAKGRVAWQHRIR